MSLNNLQVRTTVTGTNTLVADLSTRSEPINIAITKALANGTASGQANRVFMDTRSSNTGSGGHETIDIFDFGNVSDGVGQSYALSRITTLIIVNKGPSAADTYEHLMVESPNWLPPFTDHNEQAPLEPARIRIENGGFFVLHSPAGYAVADGKTLEIWSETEGSTTISYDIIVIGS